ncbi:MAG: right-handed parallel beta-helix repeat-containing protein [Planctomycetota bacterium]
MIARATALLALTLLAAPARATDWVVAPSGGDFITIQAALDVALAGDRVLVQEKPGGYSERLAFPRSGDAAAGYIELLAAPGHRPALDGAGVPGVWMITIEDRSYIRVAGLEIRNNLDVPNDGSGIRVQGEGSHIELRDNVLHDLRGFGAMAITVYGTSVTGSISDLVIDGNLVYDCEPADSEAITLNGNVERFEVTNNVVRDVNNIGIDFIGGEADINPVHVARDGVCRGNLVLRANANYGGGYAGGIYVDGGRDILIEGNTVIGCDLGIEVGAENAGITTTGVVVRGNLVYHNEKVGIVFGGYAELTGRVEDCSFVNNVVYANDTLGDGNGELWIQFADNNEVANNIFFCGPQDVLLYNGPTTSGNALDHNLWFSAASGTPLFVWGEVAYGGLAAFQAGSGQGASSIFADPLLRAPLGPDGLPGTLDEDLRVTPDSPAIDAGSNAALAGAEQDFHGLPRLFDDPDGVDTGAGAAPLVDLGAHEHHPLTADVDRLSLAAGGTQGLDLDAGAAHAGGLYLLATSASGTSPGIPIGGLTLPLNYDAVMLASLSNPDAAPFAGYQGVLDAAGEAGASLSLPAGALTSAAGLELASAYVLFDPVLGVTFASNAMPLRLAP